MWWQFLSSPPLQFAVMWANFLLLAKFPVTQQWLSGQFASSAKRAMLATFVVQAVYVSRKLWNSFTALVDSNNALVAAAGAHEQYLSKIASTSQVTATRANVVEWRSCLQSIAKWHQCNLQTAYRRWQCGQVGFPSAPASQWGILDEGQPMHVQDQFVAEQEYGEVSTDLFQYDFQLTRAFELRELQKKGAVEFTAEEDQCLQAALSLHQKFMQKCKDTNGFDCSRYQEDLKNFMKQLESELDWHNPVFKKRPAKKK